MRKLAPLLALTLLACDPSTKPEEPITGPFTTIIVSGGDQPVARGADATVGMIIEVRDVHGRLAPAVGVEWQAPAGITLPVKDPVTRPDGRAVAVIRASCVASAGAVTARTIREPANTVSFGYTVVHGAPTALFTPDSIHLLVGDVVPAKVAMRDACGTLPAPAKVSWSSTPAEVATIAGEAMTVRDVTGVAAGRALVTATADGVTDALRVAVHPPVTGLRTLAMTNTWYGGAPGSGCGLDGAGDVYCWGGSGGTAPNEAAAPRPVGARRVLSGYGFTHLTMSQAHLCALDAGGVAYCWGANAGLVGDGTSTQRLAPVAVGGSLRFTDIATGGSHTCAITAGGEAYCWGRNANGQLGDGTMADRLVPVPVATPHRFTQVAVAARFSCGITADGTAYCWGDGPDPWGSFLAQAVTTPTLLEGAPPFAGLAAGWTNACGLSLDGEAYCWGNSPVHFGEQFMPVVNSPPTRIEGTRRYETIAVGAAHACATTSAGEVDCWGANERAQLGFYDGSTTKRFAAGPVAVPPLTKVFAGTASNFTCGIAGAGEVVCWGQASAGFDYPSTVTCWWGSGIAARHHSCVPPRRIGAALPPDGG